jgi:UDP-glucose 4-epimerase
MANLLVTGGAGYIGAHTARLLLEDGHDVQVLDDLSKGYAHNVPKGRLHIISMTRHRWTRCSRRTGSMP